MTPRRISVPALFGSLLLVAALFSHLSPPIVSAQDWSPPSTVWVDTAGHTIDGLFLDDWRAFQPLYGQPITEELRARVALEGQTTRELTVQYFENIAIAYVPDSNREEWKVQALPLGKSALAADKAKLPALKKSSKDSCAGLENDCTFFADTGHTIRLGFKSFWDANDGARLIGDPLTEEVTDGSGTTTQYFENAVLRWTKSNQVTLRKVGTEAARRLKLETSKISQPVDIPIYDESLFNPPIVEVNPDQTNDDTLPVGVGGYDLGKGPGPQQGGFKEIVVSISAESMWAYEDGDLVISSLVSTGVGDVPETVTPTGDFSILVKLDSETMEGTISDQYYRVDDVPYVMYFDNSGDALHGTYWHNNFGTPMSHGCVNLPMDVAEFLYSWAPEGTAVTVID